MNASFPALPARPLESHKFDYGRIVVVGGSLGMAGAPALCAMAALRSGAGLVELLVPDPVAVVAASFDPCVMTLGLPSTAGGFSATATETILSRAAKADVVACGPGLGRGEEAAQIMRRLWDECPRPLVVDADGIRAIADRGGRSPPGERVLTPHAGELTTMLGGSAAEDRRSLERAAERWAEAHGVIILLKGNRTLITNGSLSHHNTTGNPGMATAGAGDVLTGIIAALIGQGLSCLEAARVAAWVHGRAGDLAAKVVGEMSLVATDILRWLPAAFRSISSHERPTESPGSPSG